MKIGSTDIAKMYLGSTEIAKAYLGSALAYEAGGGEEPTPVDTDGLIGQWEQEDVLSVNSSWVDRINSMGIAFNHAAKVNAGVQLDNRTKPKAAWASLSTSHNTYLNQQVDKEFTCIIDCLVKFGATGKKALVIDFGSVGSSSSGVSVLAAIGQDGSVSCGAKYNGNNTSGFSVDASTAQGVSSFSLDQYHRVSVKLGTRLVDNKQEIYAEALGLKGYAIADTPKKVSFSGCPGFTNAFGLGVAYLGESSANAYASSYLADVVYKRILLYNKAK